VKLVYLSEAQIDVDLAYEFFSNVSLEYANHFQKCLATDLKNLEKSYGWHPEHHGSHRALCKRFRTSIYYLIRPDHIIIVAILDQRFSPSHIRKILTERIPTQ
jgi:plasmid stabilization system protein ParE